MQTSRRLFNEAELQRRILLEISEIILLFQLFSGTPLSKFFKLIFFISTRKKSFYRECFRKVEHACDMNIKRNILINFGHLENESPLPLNSMQI